jgi:putative restriction endonuclease
MNPTPLEHYARLFGSLRADREGNRPRPHKPVMLLSVLALAEAGRLVDGCVRYSPDLLEIFGRFFEVVRAGSDKRTPFNPFFYLKSDGFWHLHPQPGKEAILAATRTIRGPGQLMELVSHASLDEPLLALIADRKAREVLRLALIDRYFPSQRETVLGLCREEEAIGRREQYNESGDLDTAERVAESIRDAAFGRVVRRAYDYTCAMCGVRFMLDDVILVDAAHLIPFAESHDDSPPNGMALCKNHHWLMDRHLIAPGPGRRDDFSQPIWLVSPLLDDRLEAHRACVEHKGRRVILPREERHHPSPGAIAWRAERLRT